MTEDKIQYWWDYHIQILEDEGMSDYWGWLSTLKKYMPGEADAMELLAEKSAEEKTLTKKNKIPYDQYQDTVMCWIGRSLVLNDTLKEGKLI